MLPETPPRTQLQPGSLHLTSSGTTIGSEMSAMIYHPLFIGGMIRPNATTPFRAAVLLDERDFVDVKPAAFTHLPTHDAEHEIFVQCTNDVFVSTPSSSC